MRTGLDPELLTLTEDEQIVPASYFLAPPVRTGGVLNSLSYDNAAVEIRPEADSKLQRLASRTGFLLRSARIRMRVARKQGKIPPDSHFSLIPSASVHFGARHLKSISKFGCSPSNVLKNDFDVITTTPFQSPSKTPVRSAGFHIHQELEHVNTEQPIVAILDGLLGLADVIVNDDAGWLEASRVRRLHLGYGRAGEYRARWASNSHVRILEYRVLSPWPIASNESLIWATSIVKAVCNVLPDTLFKVLDDFPRRSQITSAINEGHAEAAKSLREQCVAAWAAKGGKTNADNQQSLYAGGWRGSLRSFNRLLPKSSSSKEQEG